MSTLVLPLLMYKESGSEKKGEKKKSLVVPSWNHLYVIRNNRPILDKWAILHKEQIEKLTKEWVEKTGWKRTEKQKVLVKVKVYWNDAREKDCHNLDKLIMDSMEGIIYDNDSYALLQYIDFDIDLYNPRIEIQFELGEKFDRKERAKQQRGKKN